MTEWNLEDAQQVWFEDGRENEREEIARNALIKGASIEFVHDITGLDIEAIKSLQAGNN
jgi:predicted transposase YdaD